MLKYRLESCRRRMVKKGNVTIDGGCARLRSDKIFKINHPSTCTVKHFTDYQGGKFIRQSGI
ncbi:pectate lyase [Bacillus glycinifermentans]|nr:pectate lyase [Bacillus glycinifermentans]